MSGNYKKEDLRVKRTQISLFNAIDLMLKKKNFKHITVNDLCEEALISRAAFYAHFKDKYDLLSVWAKKYLNEYERFDIDKLVDLIINNNSKTIRHILEDADSETLKIVYNFVSSIIDASKETDANSREVKTERIVLTNFCVGGMMQVLLWQINNRYPPEFDSAKDYFGELIKTILDWDSNRDKS